MLANKALDLRLFILYTCRREQIMAVGNIREQMRKPVFLILVLVAVVGSNALSQPALEIPNNEFEFGLVPQKATATHYFWFKSVGTDTVKILTIKTGCSCATMPLEREWIAPGDSMLVGMFWDTQRRTGKMGRYPKVFTNAGPDPYRLSLTGEAQHTLDGESRPIAVRPFKWELSRIREKSIDSVAFVLRNNRENDLVPEILSFPVNECEIFIPDTLKALTDNHGYVKVRDEFSDSEFVRSITFRLNDKDETIYTIPIRRKVY